jgi:hypothetical protein
MTTINDILASEFEARLDEKVRMACALCDARDLLGDILHHLRDDVSPVSQDLLERANEWVETYDEQERADEARREAQK